MPASDRTSNADVGQQPGADPAIEPLLPSYLPARRWFSGKSRPIRSTTLFDRSTPGTALPAGTHLALVEVAFEDGATDRYFLPLVERQESAADVEGAVLGRLENGRFLVDGLEDAALARALLDAIADGATIPMRHGRIVARPTRALAEVDFDPATLAARPTRAEQSHSGYRFDDRLLLKIFRRLEAGLNPDVEIGRFLAERTTYRNVPTTLGTLDYEAGASGIEPVTLALLQPWVENEGTGWDHALRILGETLSRLAAGPETLPPAEMGYATLLEHVHAPPPPSLVSRLADDLLGAARLGRRTAELHLALASRDDDPAFRPVPITRDDLALWSSEIRAQVERSLAALREAVRSLPGPLRADAAQVLEARADLLDQLSGLADAPASGVRIRVHGDYHLGQVLCRGDDFTILDFEGEPIRPLAWRRQTHTAWRDVVGMLRSYDYAASAALLARTGDGPALRARLEPWAAAWRSWMGVAFVRRYLEVAGTAEFAVPEPATRAALFRALLLDKALYELNYELSHRPDWAPIPLRGILSLLPTPTADDAGTASDL